MLTGQNVSEQFHAAMQLQSNSQTYFVLSAQNKYEITALGSGQLRPLLAQFGGLGALRRVRPLRSLLLNRVSQARNQFKVCAVLNEVPALAAGTAVSSKRTPQAPGR